MSNVVIRGRLAGAAIALAAILSGSLALAPAAAQAQTPVTVRVDVYFYGSHVPILYGIVDGIYKKHGLDVTAQTGRGSATTIQTVVAGTDQFGFADGGTLVKFAAQGLQAKQIVGMLQTNPSIIMSMAEANIKGPKDLAGRKGGFGTGSAPEQIFPAFLKAAGVDGSAIQKVGVDIPTRDSLFLQKQTDFSFGYSVTQLPLMEEKCACKIDVIAYPKYGLNPISNGIVVSTKYAAENPEIVKKFAQATVEAIDASIKSPEKAIDAFFEYAKSTQLSRQVVTKQWEETVKLLHTDATKSKPTGVMDAGDWQKSIDLLVEYASVPKDTVKPEMVFTNEYLAQ
ncbi:ABC transporter substrate-binding protein [Bradyrhizobium canariense]|uniref:NitT/TauT family transport system substrate-binding protein n=1 Tax=Bradyrhizobium canariense TaxID=255045 RepID=A0A1H1SMP7_9BRAD|nr:ABC transporter substrate-binding protein [Bradyrhizobium canariense]SDS49294.1 NitT/TauT family transport system substrate-binding protein [Bradyrhizobium canariense]